TREGVMESTESPPSFRPFAVELQGLSQAGGKYGEFAVVAIDHVRDVMVVTHESIHGDIRRRESVAREGRPDRTGTRKAATHPGSCDERCHRNQTLLGPVVTKRRTSWSKNSRVPRPVSNSWQGSWGWTRPSLRIRRCWVCSST